MDLHQPRSFVAWASIDRFLLLRLMNIYGMGLRDCMRGMGIEPLGVAASVLHSVVWFGVVLRSALASAAWRP